MTLYGEKVPKEYKDIILQYNLVNNIMENKIKDGLNSEVFTEAKFKDFLSGKELKQTLFDSTLIEKKDKIELLTKLFYVLGGDSNGISKDKLSQAIRKFYSVLNVDTNNGALIDRQTEEVLELLGNSDNSISLNDFTNIMTSDLVFDDIQFNEIFGTSSHTQTPSNIMDSDILTKGGETKTNDKRKKYHNENYETTKGEPAFQSSKINANEGINIGTASGE